MGFKPWHNLSILLLAGAAMVGCNNTQKDKTTIAPPPNMPGSTKVPDNTSPFPTANSQNKPFATSNQNGNLTNTNFPPNTPNFPQNTGMPQNPPQFTPMPNINPQSSNIGPIGSNQPNGFTPSPNPIVPPSPTPSNGTFGIERNTVPPVQPNPNPIIDIPNPRQ